MRLNAITNVRAALAILRIDGPSFYRFGRVGRCAPVDGSIALQRGRSLEKTFRLTCSPVSATSFGPAAGPGGNFPGELARRAPENAMRPTLAGPPPAALCPRTRQL